MRARHDSPPARPTRLLAWSLAFSWGCMPIQTDTVSQRRVLESHTQDRGRGPMQYEASARLQRRADQSAFVTGQVTQFQHCRSAQVSSIETTVTQVNTPKYGYGIWLTSALGMSGIGLVALGIHEGEPYSTPTDSGQE